MFVKLFEKAIMDNWPMLTIFFITMVTMRIFYKINHHDKEPIYKELLNIIAVLYILLLFELLTNSEANLNGGFNILPFTEMTRYTFGSKLFMLNVVGNILAFIPFGFFIYDYVKPKKIWSTIIITAIVSASIEIIQLNIGRSFDVDDILLNVFGSILGYLLYIGLSAIKKHLPKLFQKDGLYNLLCIIIIIIVILYILKLMGVVTL